LALLDDILKATGIFMIAVALIFAFGFGYTFLYSSMTPPVDVAMSQSGLKYDPYRGYFYIVFVRNKSDSTQSIAVTVKSRLDFSPRRSGTVTLRPREERYVEIACEQPTSETRIDAYVELMRTAQVGVEYSEIPAHSALAFLSQGHIIEILLSVVGVGLMAAGSVRHGKGCEERTQ